MMGIAYFDYAATTFMPSCVREKIEEYHKNINVAPNRGNNKLSVLANELFESSREYIRNFFSTQEYELIFFPGATYAINVIAHSIEHMIKPMDIILLGPFEHHSNYIPWRALATRNGAIAFEMPLLETGEINVEYLKEIGDRVKVVAFSSISNTNGFKINVQQIRRLFGENVLIVSDDSQKCGHNVILEDEKVDCHILNAHKMYGPKGLAGALVNKKFINIMKPSVFGGGMVERIGFPNVFKDGVAKYECGSIDVGNCIGWMEACKYINKIGFDKIREDEKNMSSVILEELRENSNIMIVSKKYSTSLVSFVHKNIHAHDIEDIFSKNDIIIRTGHICSQNSIAKYGMKPIVRISFGIGVSKEDIEKLVYVIKETL